MKFQSKTGIILTTKELVEQWNRFSSSRDFEWVKFNLCDIAHLMGDETRSGGLLDCYIQRQKA